MAKLSTQSKTIERDDGSKTELTIAGGQEPPHRHRVRNLSRPVPGPHRPWKTGRSCFANSHPTSSTSSSSTRHCGSAAEDAAWREILDHFRLGDSDRLDRHRAEGNRVRLQHPLLRPAGIHLLASAGHQRWLPRAVQGDPRNISTSTCTVGAHMWPRPTSTAC